MQLKTKKRFFIALLWLLACWLPFHYWVVAKWDVSPWKFAGWAMYTVPQPQVHLEVFIPSPSGLKPFRQVQAHPEMQPVIESFLRARQHAGRWVKPTRVADEIFVTFPQVGHVAVVVTHRNLDRRTAMLGSQRYGYRYQRPGE